MSYVSDLHLDNSNNKAWRSWRRLAVLFKSKLHKLQRSRAVKRTTAAFSSVIRRPKNSNYHFDGHYEFGSTNKEYHKRNHHKQTWKLHNRRSFQPVYVDELFTTHHHLDHTVSLSPYCDQSNAKLGENDTTYHHQCSSDDHSSSFAAAGHLILNEVDLRAEIFIEKFWEEIKLQRQRSFGNYQD